MISHGWKWKVAAVWVMTLLALGRLSHSKKQSDPLTTTEEENAPAGVDGGGGTSGEGLSTTPPPPPPPPPTSPPPPRPNKPHIILMVADDLGWNDVSWHNNFVVTPHLGQLASDGVILNQSYVLPTCTPTRTALLSGKYPFTMGMQKGALNPLDPQGLPLTNKLLPKLLKKYGYTTHIIGKWHLGFCSWGYTPTKRGFDSFYGYYGGAEDYYTHQRSEKKVRRESRRGGRREEYLDLRNNTKPDYTKNGVYSTYVFAAAAEELIRSRDPKKPMFLYFPFQSVHGPLQVPKNYTRVFKRVGDYYRRNYLGMVMAMDDMVGRVVAALKATGHYENSVIIFTTDNGGSIKMGASNYPLRGGKSNLLEGGTRGPAFIHSPLLPNRGTVSNQLFHVTDWYRTVVGLAGGKANDPYLDSIDQWDAITGYAAPPRERLVYNIDDSENKFRAALRYNEFKLSVGAVGKKLWAPYTPLLHRQIELTLPLESEGNGTWPETTREPKNCSLSDLDDELNSVSSHCPGMSSSSEVTDAQDDPAELFEEDLDSGRSDLDPSHFDLDSVRSGFDPSHLDLDSSHSNLDSSSSDLNSSHSDLDSRRSNRLLNPHVAVYGRGSDQRKNGGNGEAVDGHRIMKDSSKVLDTRRKTPDTRRNQNKSGEKKHKKKGDKNKRRKKKQKKKKKNKNKKRRRRQKKKRPPKRKKKPIDTKNKESWNKESGFTRWWKLRSHAKISWSRTVVKTLNKYIPDETQIRLYNITADPVESTDLSLDNLEMVKYTMTYLAVQLYRYRRPNPKKRNFRGHPRYFNDVWSPGWC
ncbi:arylsulfatase B-like [Macrobrachium nipponense]|uniref:arylsulfatase B-like n=1 Tax=Macrobrachium nipponense TaxID=159736 RepID=UPI0030C880A0